MEAVLVATCDRWKSDIIPLGIFTNRRKLERQLSEMVKAEYIEIDKNAPEMPRSFSKWSIREMNDYINWLYVKEITLNEEF